MEKRSKLLVAIGIIVFIVYNVALFVFAGFSGHTATFWVSWVFMLLALCSVCVTACMLKKQGLKMRDWLFGFPALWHTTAYVIIEACLSILFMVFEKAVGIKIALPVQIVVLGVHLIFVISCFIAKDIIDEVKTGIKDKTAFIKLLRVDVEMLAEKCADTETKAEILKLADQVRYSDPMSSEVLFELEKDISLAVSECDEALAAEDYVLAIEKCKKAEMLMTERNKKCKALK